MDVLMYFGDEPHYDGKNDYMIRRVLHAKIRNHTKWAGLKHCMTEVHDTLPSVEGTCEVRVNVYQTQISV